MGCLRCLCMLPTCYARLAPPTHSHAWLAVTGGRRGPGQPLQPGHGYSAQARAAGRGAAAPNARIGCPGASTGAREARRRARAPAQKAVAERRAAPAAWPGGRCGRRRTGKRALSDRPSPSSAVMSSTLASDSAPDPQSSEPAHALLESPSSAPAAPRARRQRLHCSRWAGCGCRVGMDMIYWRQADAGAARRQPCSSGAWAGRRTPPARAPPRPRGAPGSAGCACSGSRQRAHQAQHALSRCARRAETACGRMRRGRGTLQQALLAAALADAGLAQPPQRPPQLLRFLHAAQGRQRGCTSPACARGARAVRRSCRHSCWQGAGCKAGGGCSGGPPELSAPGSTGAGRRCRVGGRASAASSQLSSAATFST